MIQKVECDKKLDVVTQYEVLANIEYDPACSDMVQNTMTKVWEAKVLIFLNLSLKGIFLDRIIS